jgi:hypothetical protein
MPTASALGKVYCPQCGSNRETAEKQTRLLLRLLPVLVMVFDAPLIVWIFIGHAEAPVLAALGAVALVPAILVVLVVRGKIRVEALWTPSWQPGTAATLHSGTESISAPGKRVAEQYRVLGELLRPRPVRMSRQGKVTITATSVALVAFAGALVAIAVLRPALPSGSAASPAGGLAAPPQNYGRPSRPVVYALPLVLIAGIGFMMRRSLAQQRRLLALGELAMARVTKQWTARNGNGIRYEFATPAGENFSRMTTDYSRQLFAGMNVPIFYDRRQPKKQVALCAAFYEIVLPGLGCTQELAQG